MGGHLWMSRVLAPLLPSLRCGESVMMLDGYAADLERHLSTGVEAPSCECGYSQLGTYCDTDDHGKVLVLAEQACPECGKHHAERVL